MTTTTTTTHRHIQLEQCERAQLWTCMECHATPYFLRTRVTSGGELLIARCFSDRAEAMRAFHEERTNR